MGSGDSKKRTGTPVENVSGFPGSGTPQVWGPKEELHAAATLSLNVCVEAVWGTLLSSHQSNPVDEKSEGTQAVHSAFLWRGRILSATAIREFNHLYIYKKGGEIIEEPPLSDY